MATGWLERLIEEKRDLDVRAAKLTEFLNSPEMGKLPNRDRVLLRRQWNLMLMLSSLLAERIERGLGA